ncbi:MAG: peroxide stress protein YaaA [Actinomycetota bacterium]
MLIVLSPAKSLDYESPLATDKRSEPTMLDQASELVEIMATKSPRQLSNLMGISAELAELNADRFQDWELPFTPETARQAILAFSGDVYQGLDAAAAFNQRDFTHSQKVLRILSGLYGVLRPLDLMMPYRLEMGTKLKTKRGKTLYDFWGTRVADELNKAMVESPGEDALINLASVEYAKAVDTTALEAPVVTPTFLDAKGSGDFKTIAFFAKRARGSMAGWIVKNRVKTVAELEGFDGLGYAYSSAHSTGDRPAFVRRNPAS